MIGDGPRAADERQYDVVIVGGGIIGAVLAKVLAEQTYRDRRAISILVLEAGRGAGLTAASHEAYLDTFYRASIKTPNAPYPASPNAPAPEDLAFLKAPADRYFRQLGLLPFGSNNTRALGGTTLHWMGIALRMMPADFRMKSIYGQGEDWPIEYSELKRYYEKAEWEIGVSACREDQLRVPGARKSNFGDYEYPMSRIPQSHLDQTLAQAIGDDFKFRLGGQSYPVRLVPLPQARNSTPMIGASDPRDYLDPARRPELYQPYGAPEEPITGPGQRCEGNASCIPICPSRAKYTALKTVQQLRELSSLPGIFVEVVTKAVASDLKIDGDGRITHINYLQYEEEDLPYATRRRAVGRRFALAASSIENAKLLLASRNDSCPTGLANSSHSVGRHLMDHPFVLAWGLMPEGGRMGPFRGPGATSDIPMRDGAFRKQHAAFRTDVGNWGWGLTDDAPSRDVERLINPEVFRNPYADKPQKDLLPDAPLFGRELREKLGAVVQRQVTLGFLMEQLPDWQNRVSIDDGWRDQLGLHRPVIQYDISDYTRAGIAEAYKLSAAFFAKVHVQDYTDHSSSLGTEIEYQGVPYRYIGAGHIMGTHRMSNDPKRSVVDKFQRSWDHNNLYIVGCGSMSTSGTSNPTLTAVALTILSAEKLYQELDLPYK